MNVNNILTFSGEKTKEQLVELAKYHRDMDLLVQGEYGKYSNLGDMNTGCSVGCMFPNKHRDGYKVAGVCPQILYLVDKYFEKQDKKDAIEFHVWFWENLPENVDSFEIFSQFMGKMLIDESCGAFGKSKESDIYLKKVSDLYLSNCKDLSLFKKAADDAAYATYAYAYAADDAYAAYAAYAAADDAYAAAAGDDKKQAFKNQINLFKEIILTFNF